MSAAERLKARKSFVVATWEQRVLQRIPAASRQNERHLRDGIPAFIDRLIAALSPDRLREIRHGEWNRVSQSHGEQRAALMHYSLDQVLREYQVLQEVILIAIEEEGPIAVSERDIILSAIADSMAQSGALYAKLTQERGATDRLSLRETQEQLHLALESAHMGTWQIDLRTRVATYSPGLMTILGLRENEANVSDAITRIIHPNDQEEVSRRWQEAVANGHPYAHEYRIVRPDGEIRWILARGKTKLGPDGEPAIFSGVAADITERKLTDSQLAASEARFRKIANTLPQIVWTADPNGFIDWHSDKYFEYTGRAPSTKFDSGESPLCPADVEPTARRWNRSVATGEVFEIEHRIRRVSDGQYRWHLARGVSIRDDEGKIVKWIGSSTEIHEQKVIQEKLQESETRFRQVANALPQIVWMADADFYVNWYNDWWFKYLGLPRGTKWDDPDTLPMHPEDVARTKPLLRDAVATGNDLMMEQRFKRGSDGQYRWHLVRGVPIRAANGTISGWVGANTDIHDHKMLLDQLERERELRERFVATLSHDLRTPLTAAKMSANLVERNPETIPANRRLAHRIADNLDRMDNMIRDLLDASRVGAQERLPLLLETCDFGATVRRTLDDLATVHGERFEFAAEPGLTGTCDPGGLRRITENLCGNAIKYGSPDRNISVRVEKRGDDRVMLSVHNWGTPIPAEDQSTLFEPYRRTAAAQQGRQRGWGLGLTLVKGIAEAHGGTVSVESSPKEGTTFRVVLPVDAVAEDQI